MRRRGTTAYVGVPLAATVAFVPSPRLGAPAIAERPVDGRRRDVTRKADDLAAARLGSNDPALRKVSSAWHLPASAVGGYGGPLSAEELAAEYEAEVRARPAHSLRSSRRRSRPAGCG